ncbi:NAD(P)/FAD-dependent oxidoreductase [Plebeiibacterium sediminum]|uniref:FAD-binding oxidoreductase n=1 Tax=Plebeiibacterium sediminum TaxID=2992112 RepID=A0AAE3M697_9BACT|nr:FAD-dependent oxidoreductase [Plebeiobacterium sediminum]MCW3787746.1 FAD-binding oxidoreductase [Plebeiobacterium sediminum]
MKVLIIGQGLAGTILSFKLIQKGHDVTVVDDPSLKKSSLVAGGMVNPVVFRRLTKSWMIDELYPEFIKTSEELETLLDVQLFYPKTIFRVLGKDEDSFWQKKYIDNGLEKYIDREPAYFPISKYLKIPFGYGKVKVGGWFDIQTLISTYNNYLKENSQLISAHIDISYDLKFSSHKVDWKGNNYDKVILCTGSAEEKNNVFKQVKFKNTLGDVLTIKSDEYSNDHIVSKNIFILPIQNNKFKTGSTFRWDFNDSQPSENAKQEITEKLNKIADFNYIIEDHQAGVRPTTNDRRPVIGFLKDNPCLGIMNGLGSKGILLSSWVANQLINKMEHPQYEIHPEIDLNRYYK